ncbi:MAG: T3SS (YopN, CesT) and YbjN peptide-binding chaperone 1 [Acidimicrobiales bacterium]
MSDATDARRAFLSTQVDSLGSLEFLMVGVPSPPFDVVQIRREADGGWVVGVGGRNEGAPFTEEQLGGLAALGFERGDVSWSTPAGGAEQALGAALGVLDRVLGVDQAAPLDVRHGSTAAEHAAQLKLTTMRTQLERVITELTKEDPAVDDDGDYVVVVNGSKVFVAPRSVPGRLPVVRVFAITNAGVQMSPELGMYLARLNFNIMFGRFSLDAENQSVWLDETLLGEHVTDDELTFTIGMVAGIADEWDDKIAAAFGGQVRQPVSTPSPELRSKPGEGGYL